MCSFSSESQISGVNILLHGVTTETRKVNRDLGWCRENTSGIQVIYMEIILFYIIYNVYNILYYFPFPFLSPILSMCPHSILSNGFKLQPLQVLLIPSKTDNIFFFGYYICVYVCKYLSYVYMNMQIWPAEFSFLLVCIYFQG